MMRQRKLIAFMVCIVICLSAIPISFMFQVSAIDQAEYEINTYLKPSAGPMQKEPQVISLSKGKIDAQEPNYILSLDGNWKMTSIGKLTNLISGEGWEGAYDAVVPGSIYTALMNAKVIEDPYVGTNMIAANKHSSKNWYFLKTFNYEGKGNAVRLNFDGLCNVADIYLNGQKVASHEGMFGGPYVDVTKFIRKGENTLVVHLFPAKDYTQTVVFNCTYGWHYAKLYPLGIWQSVSVEELPSVEIDSPFVSTFDYSKGTIDVNVDLIRQNGSGICGTVTGEIKPKNFVGDTYTFKSSIELNSQSETSIRIRCNVPNALLWWPSGYGEQNLYTLTVIWEGKDGSRDIETVDFGIRQLEYMPFPDGESSSIYNRTIVINGQPVFMKGAGWCTIDAMMRFEKEDYDKILSRAKDAGINFLRAWGGGLVETDEFYDLCDQYGICVYQEWPCCWDSHNTQPANVLKETVILGAKRLRSRASLVVWGGGNEGIASYNDSMLNEMGRLTYEYDGTRVFWRQDGGMGGGGITHDHIHWSGASPEQYLKNYADFQNLNLMEYGLDGMMNIDSIAKYATKDEMGTWPVSAKGTIAYHTATFNGYLGWNPTPHGYDVDTFIHYASSFLEVDSLEDMVLGSQLAQAQADYLSAQNSRMNNPYSSTVCVYKLNDVYPGASWALVDWYGAPKIAYYLMQDAYRPLMAAGKYSCYNTYAASGESQPFDLPVYILDDNDALSKKSDWQVKVTAYDRYLTEVKSEICKGKGSVNRVKEVGVFKLDAVQTDSSPLIITVDLLIDNKLYNRSYTYLNYESEQGSLFYLPRTNLKWSSSDNYVTITNNGRFPAVSVNFIVDDSASFTCEDNYFFLASGESVSIKVNDSTKVKGVSCFNLSNPDDNTAPSIPANTFVSSVSCDSATLTWSPSEDDISLYGYYVYLNGERVDFVFAGETSYTFYGLSEVTKYHVTVDAVDDNMNTSGKARGFTFSTDADDTSPKMKSAILDENGKILISFDKVLERSSAENIAFYRLNHGASVTKAELSEDGKTVILTTTGIRNDKIYTLGALGIQDNCYRHNRMEYMEIVMDKGLYAEISFTPSQNMTILTSGQVSKPVTALGSGKLTENGKDGFGWNCIGGGSIIESSDYTFSKGKAISLWYNGGAADSLQVLLAKGPKSSGHFEFYLSSGQLRFYAPEIGDISLNAYISSSGWHHLYFVWQDNKIDTYIDGALAGIAEINGSVTPGINSISVGSLIDGTLPFAGTVDEVRLLTRIPSGEEIAAESRHVAPTVNVDGDLCLSTKNTEFVFEDGETINLWFCADGFKDFNILLAFGTKATDRHFEIYTEQGVLKFYAPTERGGVAVSFGIQMTAYTKDWHMLTITHSGETLYAYIDGQYVGSTGTYFKATKGKTTLSIGSLVEGGFDFDGKITEVELLNTLLDKSEIMEKYKEKIILPPSDRTLSFDNSVLRLEKGAVVSLGLKAENIDYTLSVTGKAITINDNTINAIERGFAVVYAISNDGKMMSAVVVDVITDEDKLPSIDTTPIPDMESESQTSTETETETEAEMDINEESTTVKQSSDETVTGSDKKKGCKSQTCTLYLISCFPIMIALYAMVKRKQIKAK